MPDGRLMLSLLDEAALLCVDTLCCRLREQYSCCNNALCCRRRPACHIFAGFIMLVHVTRIHTPATTLVLATCRCQEADSAAHAGNMRQAAEAAAVMQELLSAGPGFYSPAAFCLTVVTQTGDHIVAAGACPIVAHVGPICDAVARQDFFEAVRASVRPSCLLVPALQLLLHMGTCNESFVEHMSKLIPGFKHLALWAARTDPRKQDCLEHACNLTMTLGEIACDPRVRTMMLVAGLLQPTAELLAKLASPLLPAVQAIVGPRLGPGLKVSVPDVGSNACSAACGTCDLHRWRPQPTAPAASGAPLGTAQTCCSSACRRLCPVSGLTSSSLPPGTVLQTQCGNARKC